MRKHDVRKWLHAILDLLPVILIPVFMIYSHRHTIDSGSIEVPQNLVVDFNQQVPNTYKDYDYSSFVGFNTICSFDVNNNDKVFFRFIPAPSGRIENVDYYQFYFDGAQSSYQVTNYIYTFINSGTINLNYAVYNSDISYLGNVNIFNLTQMFGSGNEPTIEQFNVWYPNNFYDYTLSHKELIKGYSSITYDDTDIMSQFTYQLYNSVDKYFNMGNVFHLNEVYDWFNLNIFNGQAPIYVFIVYQIVLYELIMDLLMLLYVLFMWFIDMIEKLMEKPLNSVK